MSYRYPIIGSNLSPEQESSLRVLSSFYKVVSQYTQKHVFILGIPLLFKHYKTLFEHPVFKEWHEKQLNYQTFPNFLFVSSHSICSGMFNIPDWRFCLDGWENDETLTGLVVKLDMSNVLIREAEKITYKVMSRVLKRFYGDPIPEIPPSLFNFHLFSHAVAPADAKGNYPLKKECVQPLRDYCNSECSAVRYVRSLPCAVRDIVGNPEVMTEVYPHILSQVYGSLPPNSNALQVRNTDLAKERWYEIWVGQDDFMDKDKNPILRAYQVSGESPDGQMLTFLDLVKLNRDFKADEENIDLASALDIMTDLV